MITLREAAGSITKQIEDIEGALSELAELHPMPHEARYEDARMQTTLHVTFRRFRGAWRLMSGDEVALKDAPLLARILFLEKSDEFVEDILRKIKSLPERIGLALQIGQESARRIASWLDK